MTLHEQVLGVEVGARCVSVHYNVGARFTPFTRTHTHTYMYV